MEQSQGHEKAGDVSRCSVLSAKSSVGHLYSYLREFHLSGERPQRTIHRLFCLPTPDNVSSPVLDPEDVSNKAT